jgi:acetone carboxylase alpha subunit
MVWKAQDWTMFFMGNGYMNSDWGMMGGYPSGAGYRFEAHKTGLKERIAKGQSLPLGGDGNPDDGNYEKHISRSSVVKRDQQCMTTEDCYENYDLYLNYLRGGPGFGDPIDREVDAIEKDLNGQIVLAEFAEKVYGAICSKDERGVWHVDAAATAQRRAEIRKERIARAQPTRDWMSKERERILRKDASVQVQHMYATSFGLSAKFLDSFRKFWSLPPEWTIDETALGVPSYGAKFRMDLSKLPDVHVVTLVEE